jgi:hypothetical protein
MQIGNGYGASLPGNGAPRNRPSISGRELRAWASGASPVTKLAIGAAIACGEVKITDHTVTQVARMLGLKTKQLKIVAALPAEQRSALTNRRRRNGHMSDGMIDDLVVRVGATRLMAALDRATAASVAGGGRS